MSNFRGSCHTRASFFGVFRGKQTNSKRIWRFGYRRRRKRRTIIMRTVTVWEIIVGIATILSVIFAAIQFIESISKRQLKKDSNKSLNKIQQREKEIATKLNSMDKTMISKEAQQVHQAITTLKNIADLSDKYIRHKDEVSKKNYLKKLSTYEMVKLAFEEQKTAEKFNREVITVALTQAIFPFDKMDETADVMIRMFYQKRYDKNKVLLDKLQKWFNAMSTSTSQLSEYVKTFDSKKNQEKPEPKLFNLCEKSILLKEEHDFLDEWTKYLDWYIDYLSDLLDYYIQNQLGKSQTNE